MERTRQHRSLIFRSVVTAGAVCVALALLLVAAIAFLPSFFVQSELYDNVPSNASCSEIPAASTVDQVIDDFPELGDAEPMAVERCNGALIEIQVSSHSTREKVETYLNKTGEYDDSTGWWWKSVPIEIHNV